MATPDRERRTELRGLVYRGDGAGLVAALSAEPWPEDALQLVGDGLREAVRARVDGSAELGHRLAAVLRERDWAGDEELAQELESALGSGPAPMLRPLPVDLEELSSILEGDPVQGGGRVDLTTGEVWPQMTFEEADDFGEDEEGDDEEGDRWLFVHCEGSRDGYRDMEWFIADVADPDIADRLRIAVSGRGAFRRFKDTLSRWPDLLERWYAFSDERQRGRARRWLADEGYTPAPARRPLA